MPNFFHKKKTLEKSPTICAHNLKNLNEKNKSSLLFQNLSHLFATAATGNYSRAAGIKSAPATAAATAAAGIIGFPGAAVGAIPFVFPFAPLGLGLFDTDPKRILNLLHHQSALAEEALR